MADGICSTPFEKAKAMPMSTGETAAQSVLGRAASIHMETREPKVRAEMET